MRLIIAAILSIPVYYDLGSNNQWGAFICCIGLQLLAGLDFKLREK